MDAYKSKKFTIKIASVKLPNGKSAKIEFHVGKSGACVLPIDNKGRLVLVRQYRPYIRDWIYSIPGGEKSKGEDPKEAALRELEEETGYRAGIIKLMMRYYVAPYFSTEAPYIFIATELKMARPKRDDDEIMSIRHIELHKALEMIDKGRIKDLGTIAAILMYSRTIKKFT